MFKLNNYPDDTVIINGEEVKVDMSFDNILTINDVLNDQELNDYTQIKTCYELLFDKDLDVDIHEANELFYQAYTKLVGTAEKEVQYDIKGNPMPSMSEEKEEASYDVVQDAELIFASFFQCYGIDLHDHIGKMHYYKFRALLNGLSDDTVFQQVVHIRRKELPTGNGTEKERKRLKELKKKFALKPR